MKNSLKLISIGKGHSIFSFINDYCSGETSGFSHNQAFHRLCSLMRKMDVKLAIVEDIPESYNEIKRECSALKTYYNTKINIKAYRITFLAKKISDLEAISSLEDNDFLSSSIIINYENFEKEWVSYLFSAIITIPSIRNNKKFFKIPLLNNYLQTNKTFEREVNISEDKKFKYKITGSFFCQQNSITSVCAHASLCMVLNNMDLLIDIITPEHINKIVGVDHQQKKIGINFKFTGEEIKQVLNKYGLNYELLNFFDNPNIEYNDYIYKYNESRCPVLLVFTTKTTTYHMVPVVGHTLNSDMWRPEAKTAYLPSSQLGFLPTSAWVDHFIIHDDNLGMYLCLPVDALKRITLPIHDPTFRAYYAVVIKPLEVITPSREAEWASSVIINDLVTWYKNNNISLDTWTNRLANRISKHRPIVIRTLLTKKENYMRSLEERDFEHNTFSKRDKEELNKDLPACFWLSEITLPELYTANKSKIIDFFYGCNYPANKNEINKRWIQIRFPFNLYRRNIKKFALSIKSHYPIFKLKIQQETLDW